MPSGYELVERLIGDMGVRVPSGAHISSIRVRNPKIQQRGGL